MDIKIETVKKIGEEMSNLLRLKTNPIGINFFEREEEVPKEFEKIEEDFAFCHYVGMARYHDKPIYTTIEYAKACAVGAKAIGFGEPPAGFAEQGVGTFGGTVEAMRKIPGRIKPFDEGKYATISFSPLDMAPVIPDIVQIIGNPTQLLVLIYSNTWNGEPDITLSTNGHGASCYETLVIPYREQKITMAIADMGDRRYGFASDDEMIMGVPIAKLELLHEALIKTMKTKNCYPVRYNFHPMK